MLFSYKKIYKFCFFALVLILPLILKLSFVLGSYKFFFSGINFLAPLVVIPVLGNFFAIFLFFKYLVFSKVITLGLPTIVSSLYFYVSLKNKNKFFDLSKIILSVILPLTCILIFICHPESNKAWVYSFYWFIPIICYFLEIFKIYSNIFTKSLASTFLAHAVGSIIWLYTFNMPYTQWLFLIPVVFIERFVFSSGMTIFYVLVKKIFLSNRDCYKKIQVNLF